mgnify:CR=1 FL=1
MVEVNKKNVLFGIIMVVIIVGLVLPSEYMFSWGTLLLIVMLFLIGWYFKIYLDERKEWKRMKKEHEERKQSKYN